MRVLDAEKPEEWDDEEDGDWIAPTVRNPKCDEAPGCGEWKRPYKANPNYKGKWFAPMIDNPEYKGEWAPRKIPNPNYFEDLTPAKSLIPIGGVGIELWTMTEDILFDNIYVFGKLERVFGRRPVVEVPGQTLNVNDVGWYLSRLKIFIRALFCKDGP